VNGYFPRATAAACVAVLYVIPSLVAQERYLRAEENKNHDLVITTSAGGQVVVPKSDRKWADQAQLEFRSIAVSRDGSAVGWVAYYSNCCTSYPVPILLEVYKAGNRRTLDPAIAPWHWCFVDGTDRIAAISTTVHGPQHQLIELWDVSTGRRRELFTWMDGESYPDAPTWVVAVRGSRAANIHDCSTK